MSESLLLNLPEILLFQVISFAAGPSYRASLVCHKLALLSSVSRSIFLNETSCLWDGILTHDYGATLHDSNTTRKKRSSKRLRQTHLQRVRDAHRMVRDNTEIAYYYLSEMCMMGTAKNGLTRAKLCQLLEEYGPYLRINHLTSTGGTFLVECCRARNVRESVVLRCVQELIENRGAQINLATSETHNSSLTVLCVASARAMSTVVKYLLERGADPSLRSSGRFRLYKKSRKTIKCEHQTPLGFATAIRQAEKTEGATDQELTDLDRVVKHLLHHAPSG